MTAPRERSDPNLPGYWHVAERSIGTNRDPARSFTLGCHGPLPVDNGRWTPSPPPALVRQVARRRNGVGGSSSDESERGLIQGSQAAPALASSAICRPSYRCCAKRWPSCVPTLRARSTRSSSTSGNRSHLPSRATSGCHTTTLRIRSWQAVPLAGQRHLSVDDTCQDSCPSEVMTTYSTRETVQRT